MKFILSVFVFCGAFAVKAHAGDDFELDFDQPAANHSYQVDELDAAFADDQAKAPMANADTSATKVKIELNQSEPSVLTPEESMTPAEKLALDKEKRQKAILKELSEGSAFVKTCITRNNINFRGTHITLQWVVSPMGKVQETKIKSTDIGDLAIRDCIKRAAGHFDFSDARGDKFKTSMVEYTFRFNNRKPKTSAKNSLAETN